MRKIIVLAVFVLALAGCSSDKAATETESEVKPVETAEAKPAEAAEAKPAEAKPAEAEAAKPAEAKEGEAKPADGEAKPAEAKEGEAKEGEAAPQPIVTAPRDFRDIKAEQVYLVTIEADKEYDIGVKGLTANLEMKAGETLRFQLTDLLEAGQWVVRANDDQVVGVALGVFKASLEKGVRSVTAVDLKAVKPGTSVLEMNYINKLQSIQRVFRCYITVK